MHNDCRHGAKRYRLLPSNLVKLVLIALIETIKINRQIYIHNRSHFITIFVYGYTHTQCFDINLTLKILLRLSNQNFQRLILNVILY